MKWVYKMMKEEMDKGQHKLLEMRQRLARNKMFFNMVIHDMRNPTVSTKLGLNECINHLSSITSMLNDQIVIDELSIKVATQLKHGSELDQIPVQSVHQSEFTSERLNELRRRAAQLFEEASKDIADILG